MEPDDEKEKFKTFAKVWWDEYGPARCLHAMNPLRIPHILDCLQNSGIIKSDNLAKEYPLEGITILDVGCGAGFMSEALAELGGEVVGIDAVPEIITAANQHATALDEKIRAKLTYFTQSAIEFAENEDERKYDVVLMLEVLDHVIDHKIFVEAATRRLRPGGAVFASTMNTGRLSWILCKFLPEYVLNFIPRGAHDYSKFIGLDDTKRLLEANNFTIRGTRGMYYNRFGNYWFWLNTTSAWYFIHATKD